jgi:hypothetical protein
MHLNNNEATRTRWVISQSDSAYASIHIAVNVAREQLYQGVQKSSGNHVLKLTNLWHAYPKWHTERFPRPMIFTTAQNFFFISFPHPASQYCERYVCVCVYIYIYICLHGNCIEVPLLTNNTCCKWNVLHKLGAARSVDWIFIIPAPPWQWLGEYETLDEMFYHPHNKTLIQVTKWDPEEHPLPTKMAVAMFL